MDFSAVLTATALSSAVASIFTGIVGNLPFGLAPGMGLNSYFTYGVCLKLGLSWNIALTSSFFMGVVFFLLSISGLCTYIQTAAPQSIKKGITVGLGLLQALIGLEMVGAIVRGDQTLLEAGDFLSSRVLLGFAGIVLISCLLICNISGAMLIGLGVITSVSWIAGLTSPPEGVLSWPTLEGTFNVLDFEGFFFHWKDTFPVTLVFLFVAVLDTAGVHFALGCQNKYVGRGLKDGSGGAFVAASFASATGALMGTSPVIIHNESCAGIQDGGRTGLSAVSAGFGFLLCLPFLPIFRAVPDTAAAAPLFIVGMLMMGAARYVNWSRVEDALPAFTTLSVLPLTYSIAHGMAAGLVAFGILKPLAMCMERFYPSALGVLDEGAGGVDDAEGDNTNSSLPSTCPTPLLLTTPTAHSFMMSFSTNEEAAAIHANDSRLCFAPHIETTNHAHPHPHPHPHPHAQDHEKTHVLSSSLSSSLSSFSSRSAASEVVELEEPEGSSPIVSQDQGAWEKYRKNQNDKKGKDHAHGHAHGPYIYPHSTINSNLVTINPYLGGKKVDRGQDPYSLTLNSEVEKKTASKR